MAALAARGVAAHLVGEVKKVKPGIPGPPVAVALR
jgi:hypothetical protein